VQIQTGTEMHGRHASVHYTCSSKADVLPRPKVTVMESEVKRLKFDTYCIGLAIRQASLMCYAFMAV
jgi:hypothetical protein